MSSLRLASLRDAVAEHVRDGDTVALEGTSHLVPFAAAHELIRQGRRELTVARVAPDIVLDQLVGMGAARALVFAWGGRPGLARLPRLREALERAPPLGPAVEQLRPTDMADAYEAGASGLPFAPLRGYGAAVPAPRTSLVERLPCPITGREHAVVRAIRPDVAIVHAQEADRHGNVLLWGMLGVQKAAVLAGRRAIVTVEEVVDDLRAWPNAYRLPAAAVSAVCVVPGGAHPSPVQGHYERDHAFYKGWAAVARTPGTFRAWMERYVLATPDFAAFRQALEGVRDSSSYP